MFFQDKTLTCKECGQDFVFTAGEQEFYAKKGFANEPARCPHCRAAKKERLSYNGSRREMFTAVCAQCGAEAQVPFKPTGDRPVYCSDCFNSRKSFA